MDQRNFQFPENKSTPFPLTEAGPLLGGISRSSLIRLMNAGDLETILIGRRRMVTIELIDRCKARLYKRTNAGR